MFAWLAGMCYGGGMLTLQELALAALEARERAEIERQLAELAATVDLKPKPPEEPGG